MRMEVQTRSEENGLKFYSTLTDAFRAAQIDTSVWKISFNAYDGTRVRLVRTSEGWIYEDITGVRPK